MTTSWVAGTVRARALARRRVGAEAARGLATVGIADALQALAQTPYGHDVQPHDSVDVAQHAVGSTLLWHLRVLAGWLPRAGVDVIRLLSGGFEIANLDDRLACNGGSHPAPPPFRLGALATAGSRIENAASAADLRAVLRTSPWGDPGGARSWEVGCGLRLNWADQIVGRVPEAASWARAATALLLFRVVRVQRRSLSSPLSRRAETVVGRGFVDTVGSLAITIAELARRLPVDARWVFDGVDRPDEAWRADAHWHQRVEADGFALLRNAGFGRAPVVGAVAVLAIDAWRVRAALSAAARRAVIGAAATEAFDAMAMGSSDAVA